MAHSTALAIAPQVEDNFSDAVTEFQKEIEQRVSAVAPDPVFDYVPEPHREFAQNAIKEFNRREIERLQGELVQGRQIVEASVRLTRRKEFSRWKQSLNATAAEVRKRVKLALTFGDFPIEKIMAIAASTNIYSLCVPKFEELVEKLRNLPVLASDQIKQMVKEARPPRKTKQQPESSVEWYRDQSGGGRHLAINLYDDELGVKIKHDAEKQQITPQQVIKQAFRNSELVEEVQREHTEAVNEVRQMHIQMQREIHQQQEVIQHQCERIEELQARQGNRLNTRTVSQLDEDKKPAIYIENFTTWEQLAEAVNCERVRLLAVARLASEQERSHFAQLLAEFCEENPKAFDRVDWVPPRLLNSALAQLSFSISRLADTHIADDPVLETIQNCKFVSVKNLGIPGERWVFQLPDRKNIPIYERCQRSWLAPSGSQFEVERF